MRWLGAAALAAVAAGCATQQPKTPTPPPPSQVSVRAPTHSSVTVVRSTVSQEDLWDRIRNGFAMPDLHNATVREKEDYYTRRPDYMQRMVSRSNKYLYHVVEEIERRRMPTELALLPFVESAFNPNAVSSAKAAGMWQFIPSTGRHFSLQQNFFRDERRDILHSTRAALDYLQRLYDMFGDWHLALAAYNWGEGSVQRAIARNRAAGLGTSYEDLRMPNETREYVPKLQAIKNIVRNPATFNTTLPSVANHPYFKKVSIKRDMDVAIAAQLAGISEQDFKALNPATNRSLIIASATPHILLPWDSVDTFEQNLEAMQDRQLASWTVWVPPQNVTLAQVAEQTGATVDALREINKISPHARIKAGSIILVPRAKGQEAEIPLSIANSSVGLRLAYEGAPASRSLQKVVLKRSSIKARKGDTIASIAARYGLSPTTVARWNRAKPGQKLAPGKAVVLHLPQTTGGGRNGRSQMVATRAGRGNDKVAAVEKRGGSKKQATAQKGGKKAAAEAQTAQRGGQQAANQKGRAAASKTSANQGKARAVSAGAGKAAPAKASAKKAAPAKKKK
ncbi:MAG: transglycosylase SLT domain-containing protein [Brachymonas sp.]|nr:transglycosylase SLT domain-containing protein [Brachymonas sp.]